MSKKSNIPNALSFQTILPARSGQVRNDFNYVYSLLCLLCSPIERNFLKAVPESKPTQLMK